jgi:uncharacterized protein (DUF1697 family)
MEAQAQGQAYVGLLRGVNVSGAGKLPSALLAEIATHRLKLAAVRTYIQSGNLVFAAPAADGLEDRLAAEIEAACHFRPVAFIRSFDDWNALMAGNPFGSEAKAEPKNVHLCLLGGQPSSEALADLRSRDFGADQWHKAPGAIHLHLPNGSGRSKLATSIERILKVPTTARNWSTVLALSELCRQITLKS